MKKATIMNEKSSKGKEDQKECIKGTITARKCDCCGHHEIGITTQSGEYISLKPGMKVQIELTKNNISKEQALEIFKAHVAMDEQKIHRITDSPPNVNVYGMPSEECWHILCSYNQHAPTMLASSRLICISKITGRILFDGSSNNEG